MAGAERIIHICIGQGSELLAEGIFVLGFFLAEAGVLQQHNIAVAHRGGSGLGLGADNIVVIGEGDRLAEFFRQAGRNRRKAELGFGAILRLAEMAAQDHLGAVLNQLLDGRQRGVDTVVVGDDAVLHRDVEVTADKHPLAGVVFIVDGLFAQTHGKNSSRSHLQIIDPASALSAIAVPASIIRRIPPARKRKLIVF